MSETRRPLIWIVEDDCAFAQSLCDELEDRGYRTRVFADGDNLTACLHRELPDFAVVDLRLGGESGLDLLRIITSGAPRCRAVLLTGYGSIATAVRAMKYGAVDYLTKPVDIDHLVTVLRDLGSPLATVTFQNDADSRDASGADGASSGATLARHEREYIEYVLTLCDGNISRAAKWLGIHRQSLQRKLRKYPPRQ